MNKGIFCISIDTELLWGRKDLNYASYISRTKKERLIIKKLLELFVKYQVSSTWAVVGKMIAKGDPLWYGNDIIELIKKTKTQEIASHSFSHEIFSKIDTKKAEEEIKKFRAKSFVFPRNEIGYLHLLKKHGFIAFRGRDKTNLELLMPRIPPVYSPTYSRGLINIPGSMYFVSARGIKKYLPKGLRFFKAKLGIDMAIKKGKVFHLWFHPVDFADNQDVLIDEFEKILQYAAKKVKSGDLKFMTMKEIALENRLK